MIDSFIEMTRRIIGRDGIEAYSPTLLLPAMRDIRVLEDVPAGADLKYVVASWAQEAAGPGEDFVAAYGVDNGHFMVLARIDGLEYERLCPVSES